MDSAIFGPPAHPGSRRALITGATAGIGAAFARRLAADGYDLVLVSRDGERLTESAELLHETYGVEVEALAADLTDDKGCAVVEGRVSDAARRVDFLVNNAGMGLAHGFFGSPVEDEDRQLRLNVRAVLRLTHAAVPSMMDRGWGAVVNVSSVAGFGPFSPGSTYNASKAWVTNFSESIGQAVQGKGVRVMALCPGFVRTEFHRRAGIETGGIPDGLWLDADSVVAAGLRDLDRARLVSIPTARYRVVSEVVRHAPRSLLYRLAGRMRKRSGRGGID